MSVKKPEKKKTLKESAGELAIPADEVVKKPKTIPSTKVEDANEEEKDRLVSHPHFTVSLRVIFKLTFPEGKDMAEGKLLAALKKLCAEAQITLPVSPVLPVLSKVGEDELIAPDVTNVCCNLNTGSIFIDKLGK